VRRLVARPGAQDGRAAPAWRRLELPAERSQGVRFWIWNRFNLAAPLLFAKSGFVQ